jgi:hypothetical protein
VGWAKGIELATWKMFWPARLAFYPPTVIALPAGRWILSALILISRSYLSHNSGHPPAGAGSATRWQGTVPIAEISIDVSRGKPVIEVG